MCSCPNEEIIVRVQSEYNFLKKKQEQQKKSTEKSLFFLRLNKRIGK